MRLSPTHFLFPLFALTLYACSKTTVQPLAEASLDGAWTLTRLDGKDVPATPAVTATITGDKISLQGPVNRISGALAGGKLGPMMSTRMAGPPELMDYETNLLKALESAPLTQLTADTIEFRNTRSTATFTRDQK